MNEHSISQSVCLRILVYAAILLCHHASATFIATTDVAIFINPLNIKTSPRSRTTSPSQLNSQQASPWLRATQFCSITSPLSQLNAQPSNTDANIQQEHSSGRRWKNKRKRQRFLRAPSRAATLQDEAALTEQLGYVPPNLCRVSARSADLSCDTSCNASLGTVIDTSSTDIGRPIAILSYPLLVQLLNADGEGTGEVSYRDCNITPFPTIYWLADPHVSKALSELERQGYVRTFQTKLESNTEQAKEWLDCHEQYALERWNLLSEKDRDWLLQSESTSVEEEKELLKIESMRVMIQCSGVAGTDHRGLKQPDIPDNELFIPSVKCLHSHYAHYRSQVSKQQASRGDTDQDGVILNIVGLWTHELLVEQFPELVL